MRKLLHLLTIILCLNAPMAGIVGISTVGMMGMVGCGPPGEPEDVPDDYDPSTEEGYGEDMEEEGDDENVESDEMG